MWCRGGRAERSDPTEVQIQSKKRKKCSTTKPSTSPGQTISNWQQNQPTAPPKNLSTSAMIVERGIEGGGPINLIQLRFRSRQVGSRKFLTTNPSPYPGKKFSNLSSNQPAMTRNNPLLHALLASGAPGGGRPRNVFQLRLLTDQSECLF